LTRFKEREIKKRVPEIEQQILEALDEDEGPESGKP
jgi:hypothetical protein